MLQCECEIDGFCQRYGREMYGRMRELCRGINVDMGTAAAFREQWVREANVKPIPTGQPIPLLLKTDQAPGDAVAMTAAIYSLHQAHPGKYLTAVESPWPDVFAHNPGVISQEELPVAQELRMHYPAIHRANERGIHFMQGWCEFIGAAIGIDVPLMTNRPHLYFEEPAPPVGDFWLVCSGGKRDFTNKMWGHHNYQRVVDILDDRINFVQVGAIKDDHPYLRSQRGVEDAIGMTNLRQLFGLVRRSRGILCGVSLLMHVAAALEKPAVVIAGGREPVQWNAYPRQQYLHTVGALPCSTLQGYVGGACWRSRVQSLGDGSALDKDLCERPVNGTPTLLSRYTTPECMTLIRPEDVANKILMYDRMY